MQKYKYHKRHRNLFDTSNEAGLKVNPENTKRMRICLVTGIQGNAIIRGSFEKFVDSYYYSESELCGGAVTVSPLATDALLATLYPLLENVLQTICR